MCWTIVFLNLQLYTCCRYKPLQEPQSGENKENSDYSHPRRVLSSTSKSQLQCADNEYDYPNNSNSNSNNSPVQIYDQIRVPSEDAHYQTPRQARKLPPPPTAKKGQFKHHTYEPLLPKEDKDTYVYMAPLSDYPELLQQEVMQQTIGSLSPRTSDSQRWYKTLTWVLFCMLLKLLFTYLLGTI